MSGYERVQKSASTVLGRFARKVRDEPLHYVFKRKIWVEQDTVPAEEVLAWLDQRYVEHKTSHRFRVQTYRHQDGNRYVDFVLMEHISDKDLVWFKLRWGFSETKVFRGQRFSKRRLNKAQRAELNALIKKVEDDYYETLF